MTKEWQKANTYFPGRPDNYLLSGLCSFILFYYFLLPAPVTKRLMFKLEVHNPSCRGLSQLICCCSVNRLHPIPVVVAAATHIYICLYICTQCNTHKKDVCREKYAASACKMGLKWLQNKTKEGSRDKEEGMGGLSQPRATQVWMCKLCLRTHKHTCVVTKQHEPSAFCNHQPIVPQNESRPSGCVQDSAALPDRYVLSLVSLGTPRQQQLQL